MSTKYNQLLDARYNVWRNLPNGPTTFSRCVCGRAQGRGGGPCILCAEEALADVIGTPNARRYVAAVRRVRRMESEQEEFCT